MVGLKPEKIPYKRKTKKHSILSRNEFRVSPRDFHLKSQNDSNKQNKYVLCPFELINFGANLADDKLMYSFPTPSNVKQD